MKKIIALIALLSLFLLASSCAFKTSMEGLAKRISNLEQRVADHARDISSIKRGEPNIFINNEPVSPGRVIISNGAITVLAEEATGQSKIFMNNKFVPDKRIKRSDNGITIFSE